MLLLISFIAMYTRRRCVEVCVLYPTVARFRLLAEAGLL